MSWDHWKVPVDLVEEDAATPYSQRTGAGVSEGYLYCFRRMGMGRVGRPPTVRELARHCGWSKGKASEVLNRAVSDWQDDCGQCGYPGWDGIFTGRQATARSRGHNEDTGPSFCEDTTTPVNTAHATVCEDTTGTPEGHNEDLTRVPYTQKREERKQEEPEQATPEPVKAERPDWLSSKVRPSSITPEAREVFLHWRDFQKTPKSCKLTAPRLSLLNSALADYSTDQLCRLVDFAYLGTEADLKAFWRAWRGEDGQSRPGLEMLTRQANVARNVEMAGAWTPGKTQGPVKGPSRGSIDHTCATVWATLVEMAGEGFVALSDDVPDRVRAAVNARGGAATLLPALRKAAGTHWMDYKYRQWCEAWQATEPAPQTTPQLQLVRNTP